MKIILYIKINIIFLLFLLSTGFTQNVYFVAMEGDNSNPGTFEKPWKTIQYAVNHVQAGDILNIIAGTYNERISISASGTEQSPIVIKNYENDLVKINASNKSFALVIDGCQYIVINGLTIFGTKGSNNESCNVYLKNQSSHITIQECNIYNGKYGILNSNIWTGHELTHISIINCEIHNNRQQGIRILGTKTLECNNILISGNNIYDNGYAKTGGDGEWGVGIYIKCDSSIIENNNIYHNNGEGIFMDSFSDSHCHHNIVRINHIYNNGWNGIMFAGQDFCLIYDNKIHDNGWNFQQNALHGIYLAQTDHTIIFNNEIYNHTNGSAVRLEGNFNVVRDNHFYNNGTGMYSTDCYGKTSYCNIIRNNLMYANIQKYDGAIPGSGLEVDGTVELRLYNNVFYNNEGYGCAFVMGHHSASSGIKVRNNIIMNDRLEHIWTQTGSEVGYKENHNNIYPDKANAINFKGTRYQLADYKISTGQGGNTISMDPLFIANNNFHLSPGSPSIDAGGFLTTTISSDSGNSIRVKDVIYFCDGYGITQGDLIQLEGQTQTVRITNVDYKNNILTIDGPLTWTKGQGVSLPYFGSAPDIGAFEYSSSVAVELSSFDAFVNDKTVQLIWHTISETNNYGFEVERRSLESVYIKIGFVKGHKTTVSPQIYKFLDENLKEGQYYYRLKQIDLNGSFKSYGPIEVYFQKVDRFDLQQNFPNPFNPETEISFSIPVNLYVDLSVFNIAGQKVVTLIQKEQSAGLHSVKWNGVDDNGLKVSDGTYFYRLTTKHYSSVIKMLLLR